MAELPIERGAREAERPGGPALVSGHLLEDPANVPFIRRFQGEVLISVQRFARSILRVAVTR
jgi:hypothetical protein